MPYSFRPFVIIGAALLLYLVLFIVHSSRNPLEALLFMLS